MPCGGESLMSFGVGREPQTTSHQAPIPIGRKIAERQNELDAAELQENGIRVVRDLGGEVLPISGASVVQLHALEDSPDLDHEVECISTALRVVEEKLSYLAGAMDGESLGTAVVGSMVKSAAEMRGQVRPLRMAVRDGGEAA
jgi:hypothetical protein